MSLRCMNCRATLTAIAAGHASESGRLEVEAHLQGCAACREEQARWAVIAELKAAGPQQLSSDARERVRRAMMRASAESLGERSVAVLAPGSWRFAFAGVAAVAAVVLAVGLGATLRRGPSAAVVAGEVAVGGVAASPGTAIHDGQQLSTARGGLVRLDGPLVELAAGARVVWSRDRHAIRLEQGQVTVDVEPGRGLQFRVVAEHFAAEVVGTRFVVTASTVYTERGKVRVMAGNGVELALVNAGERWSLPEPAQPIALAPVQRPAPPLASSPAVDIAAPIAPRALPAYSGQARQPKQPGQKDTRPSLEELIVAARTAVYGRRTQEGRALLDQVLRRRPPAAIDAEAGMLLADAAMAEGRRDEQLRHYRDVARRHPQQPEAETALYAMAQFESEAGHRDEARRAINDYLARYPHGRFQSEARARLSQLDPK